MKTKLRWAPFGVASLALFAACSHTIESPTPKGSRAEPDLVCNEKPAQLPFSNVMLHGDNFTPMPSKTLEGKRQLILPKVELLEGTALPVDGAPPVPSKPYPISDDPANPAASRVHWISEQMMSIDIRPEDKDPAGVFSIKVTNPDGTHAVTIAKGIAVIPAPIVSEVKPPAICDDQSDQQVTITGTYFLKYDDKTPTVKVGDKEYTPTFDEMDCKPVPGNFVEKNVELCTAMTITIPQGDFPVTMPTKVPLVVTNPAPADCQSSAAVELTIEPPPSVTAVVPATVCQGGSQLTITGTGFLPGATASLDCMGTVTQASSTTVSPDGTTITATFGGGATPGTTCDVIVTNADGCQDRPLPHKTVTVTTGPILFYVDPPVVYNGINTRVTLFATTITPPLPVDAVTIVPTGMNAPITTLTYNPVPNHPNRLQAIVPTGQAPGVYDMTLKDSSGCFATLPKAIDVTADLTVTIKSINPPFGPTADDTAVTIFRDAMAAAPADKPFVETPRVFLNPTNPQPDDIATEVENVSFIDQDTVTGVVPAGTTVHKYDVVLVNPDGSVGLKPAAYDEVTNAPPVVTGATPSSIISATGQKVVLAGKNFDAADMVTLTCVDAMGNPVPSPNVTAVAPVCNAGACTQDITIDGSTLAAGDVCVVRVANPDGTYGEYSAIGVTNSSLNLNSPHTGTDMNVGRRALSAASGNATPAARFVYALGGDNGTAAGALDSTEFAPVDLFGKMGAWTTQITPLGSKRTLAGATTIGRYIYLVGGDDGAGPLATAERALILSPRETPVISDVDLALQMAGLDEGTWHYRVSATFDAADTDNPGGESLPSDEFTIKLPAFPGKKIAVTLVWKAPLDSLKAPLPGVNGYKVYRTPMVNGMPGTEVLLATINNPATLTYTDDGTAMPGTATPLPTGSTGAWYKLPNLGSPRSGPSVVSAPDPTAPNTLYVYALLGKSAAATAAATYELLTVTVAPNGRQTVGAAWAPGATPSSVARWQSGAWVVDKSVQSNYAPSTWVFLGGGMAANNTLLGTVDAAQVQAGGQLGAFNDAGVKDFSSNAAGYGVCAANQQLFVFGGQGATPFAGAKSAALFTPPNPASMIPPPGLANNAWNNEGLTMTHGRYLLGSSVQSAFIFLLGGQTDEPSPASKTTELVIW